jgi:hypothetical protein
MSSRIESTLVRTSVYGELLREGAVLLAVFGPIASLEIIKAFPLKLALAIFGTAAIMLIVGVELEVHVRRTERELPTPSGNQLGVF